MKTYLPQSSEIKRRWYELDASAFTLGRLATKVATLLHGKHKPIFTPHLDVGDYVVVTNAKRVRLTGQKLLQKELITFSGYPGGIRRHPYREVLVKNPEKVIYSAIYNMLPANRLRTRMLRRLKIVPADKHRFKIDLKVSP